MESFSADWLALREPADHAARAQALTAAVADRLATSGATRAVDLAAGSGSNVRYLLPRLPGIREWVLVDHDADLLARARASLAPVAAAAGAVVETHVADLREVAALPLEGCGLVAASALLDLVSTSWLDAIAGRCRAVGADVLFTLSYDGRLECAPSDSWDARVRELVNVHQRTDKGLGPALGSEAVAATARAFQTWRVQTAASEWVLDAAHAELQRQLVDGWASAAAEIAPRDAQLIEGWRLRRRAAIDDGTSVIRVGHQDVFACLGDCPHSGRGQTSADVRR